MQTPVEYHTVFTVFQKPAPSSQDLVIVPVTLIAVGIVVGAIGIIRRKSFRRVRTSALIVCSLLGLSGIYILHEVSGVVARQRDYYDRMTTVYLAGQYSVVEGPVANFHPMPSTGHDHETFSVSGAHFSFSDFDGSPCFNNAASRGGPMREGVRVRIAYSDNCILKLEVATKR
jgi:hypothetical protein